MVQSVLFNPSVYIIPLVDQLSWTSLALTLALTYIALRTLLWHLRVGDHGNRYVMVTGCDTGFGADLVKRLEELGFWVFAGCLTSQGFQRIKEEGNGRVVPVLLDVTDMDSIRDAVTLVKTRIPDGVGLWALVNNAGIMPSMAPLELTSRDTFQQTLSVNLIGMIEMTRACLPLVRQSRGRIINMSSVTGRLGFTAIDYTVSKFGVEGFSECLRREVHRDGVRVSVIEPGGFKTNLLDFRQVFQRMDKAFAALDRQVQQHFGDDYVAARKQMFGFLAEKVGFGSSALYQVTDVYLHALCARFPRTRYAAGLDAKLLFVPLSYVPDWLADLVMVYCWPFNNFLV